ncbi:MAG: amidohydrolase family protein [Gammaproteobacteria bacterium]|nr:amidohydrolase family protein [Gammaproteobacteria bacterium]
MRSKTRTPLLAALIIAGAALPQLPVTAHAAAGDIPAQLIRYADLVFFNGQVLTVDAENSVAAAIAVRDGRVLAVGDSDAVLALAGPQTERVDLAGRTLTPGYIYNDGDNAVPGGDIYKDTMVGGWLSGRIAGKEMEVLLSSLDDVIEQAQPAEPVFVNMPKNFPLQAFDWTADDLDKIAPDNPIALFYTSSDSIVNHAMLERAFAMGLPKDHFGIVKDDNGEPTGALVHEATGFIGWQARPYPSRKYIEKGIRDAKASFLGYLSAGVTTTTGHMSGLTISMLNEIFHKGELSMRVFPGHDMTRQNPFPEQYLKRVGNLVDFSLYDPERGPMVKIVGAALASLDDGPNSPSGILTIQPKDRIMPELGGTPYGWNKWSGESVTGLSWDDLTDEQKLQTDWNTMRLLIKYGWNTSGNHNMGSGAMQVVLDAVENAYGEDEVLFEQIKPNAYDHNVIWHEDNFALIDKYNDQLRFGLKINEYFDPRLVDGKSPLLYEYASQLDTMQPVKDLLERGVNVHFEGSDASNHPMKMIKWAVTRSDDQGRVIAPAQAIDRETALRMITWNAARFIGEEANLGSLEPGKWADLVVLNGDFLAVPDADLDKLHIELTYVAGQLAYDAGLWQ